MPDNSKAAKPPPASGSCLACGAWVSRKDAVCGLCCLDGWSVRLVWSEESGEYVPTAVHEGVDGAIVSRPSSPALEDVLRRRCETWFRYLTLILAESNDVRQALGKASEDVLPAWQYNAWVEALDDARDAVDVHLNRQECEQQPNSVAAALHVYRSEARDNADEVERLKLETRMLEDAVLLLWHRAAHRAGAAAQGGDTAADGLLCPPAPPHRARAGDGADQRVGGTREEGHRRWMTTRS